MKVELLTSKEFIQEQESQAVQAMLICHDNENKAVNNRECLERIIKSGHESILEHIKFTYRIENISRALLQELARHRFLSLSVESTRHTLIKKISEYAENLPEFDNMPPDSAKIFIEVLNNLRVNHPEIRNDELKYFLPEFWPVKLIMSANVRELRHVIRLRSRPEALREFQELARRLYFAVPEEFKYLFADCVYQEGKIC